MENYKEIRQISAEDLRNLCILNHWYTSGTSAEYNHLLYDLVGKDNLTTKDIIEIAEDIIAHSRRPSIIEDIAFQLVEISHTFFSVV